MIIDTRSTAAVSALCSLGQNYTCLLLSEDVSLKIAVALCHFVFSFIWVFSSLSQYGWAVGYDHIYVVLSVLAEDFLWEVADFSCDDNDDDDDGWRFYTLTGWIWRGPFSPSDNNAANLRTQSIEPWLMLHFGLDCVSCDLWCSATQSYASHLRWPASGLVLLLSSSPKVMTSSTALQGVCSYL